MSDTNREKTSLTVSPLMAISGLAPGMQLLLGRIKMYGHLGLAVPLAETST